MKFLTITETADLLYMLSVSKFIISEIVFPVSKFINSLIIIISDSFVSMKINQKFLFFLIFKR